MYLFYYFFNPSWLFKNPRHEKLIWRNNPPPIKVVKDGRKDKRKLWYYFDNWEGKCQFSSCSTFFQSPRRSPPQMATNFSSHYSSKQHRLIFSDAEKTSVNRVSVLCSEKGGRSCSVCLNLIHAIGDPAADCGWCPSDRVCSLQVQCQVSRLRMICGDSYFSLVNFLKLSRMIF